MIDLHTHTTSSDGEYTEKELIQMAIEKGITTIAITNHDTIDNLDIAMDYANNKNINVICGVEIDTQFKGGQMHVLGLGIDVKNTELKDKLYKLQESREIRNNKFIEEFNRLGFEITLEELQEASGGDVIGKPHFAKVFVEKGYTKERDEIFDLYFSNTTFKQIQDKYKIVYTPQDVFNMIKQANGLVILAHPQTLKLNNEDLEQKLIEWKSYGLDGLECYHSGQTEEQMIEYLHLAQKLNLCITKGSDYHGPAVKKAIKLGTGINNNILNENEENIEKDILNKLNYKG